jgi:glutaminyl-tRNA synthetase
MEEMSNFIKTIMINDLESGKVKSIVTRFPPEPNAYLHIGHARAIITNFELANSFGGKTNLRFDDTNPAKEDVEFVKAIEKDIEWLGYHPAKVLYGSDYFDETYELAVKLIKKGLAYVCDLTPEETSKYRGDFNTPGIESPYRNRSVEENLELFKNMKEGKYQEGERVLRAKIDMASPNINMRDPVLYRILYISHHRTKDKWCIYPMYDFAHPIQDAIEGITHSLCSLEYDNHRPLYDWVVEKCEMPHVPQQIEFGRLNITNTVMSKRYLRELVNSKKVTGYDDPRMPTLVGLARRGYTPESIKNFVKASGLSRINSTIEGDMLEHFLREDLKLKTNRLMAVLDPLKIVITNYEEGKIEYLEANNNNENEECLISLAFLFPLPLVILNLLLLFFPFLPVLLFLYLGVPSLFLFLSPWLNVPFLLLFPSPWLNVPFLLLFPSPWLNVPFLLLFPSPWLNVLSLLPLLFP